jgi:hypothetical protein
MAVTRIKNNQITDAINGNVQPGINAAAKLQNYSITSNKIANSLVYGSDLTVSGNLTVNGTTTTIDTINTLIEDPIITLADGQTSGTPTVDIGVLGLRGNLNSSFLGWNEANTQFAAVLSNTTSSNTTVNITAYADFRAANVTGANLLTSGLLSATGNVTGGNLTTGGQVSATGNISGGNISTAGNVTASYFIGNISGNIDAAGSNTQVQFNDVGDILGASANFTFDKGTNVLTVSNGNVQGGNLLTGGLVSATGNVTGGNLTTAGNVYAPAIVNNGTYNTQIELGAASGIIAVTTNANATQFLPGGQIRVSGDATIYGGTLDGSQLVLGTSQTDLVQNRGGNVTVQVGTGGSTANTWTFAQSGALLAPGAVSAVGNVTGGNVLTGGLISAGGNITSNTNVNTPNVVGSTGLTLSTGGNANINIEPAGTGNIIVNNRYINGLQLTPLQDGDAASKYYVDTIATTGLTFHEAVFATTNTTLATATSGNISYTQPNGVSNGIGAFISTTGTFTTIDTANVQTAGTRILVKNEANAVLNGVYTYTNATSITRSTDTDQYGSQSTESFSINDYFFTTNGNVNSGAAFVVDAPAGVITFGTSNISFAQFSSSQTYTANTSAGLVLVNQQFNAKVDNITTAFDGGGNISVKVSANLTTPNIGAATGTSLSVTGDVTANTNISAVGNVIGGNVSTAGLITATGNITGGNVLTGGLISATGNATAGNINTAGLASVTGNVIGGNILTGGLVSATGNLTSGNVNTAIVSATGQIVSTATGNLSDGGGQIYLNGAANNRIDFNTQGTGAPTFTTRSAGTKLVLFPNLGAAAADYALGIDSGTFWSGVPDTSGQFKWYAGTTAVANLSGAGAFSAAGNVTGANLLTGGLISAGGNITGSNLILTSGTIDGPASGRITINSSDIDTDFAVDGDTVANIFYVDAGTSTVSVGNSTQYTNVLASFNSTTTIKLPVGTLGERPAVGVTGMIRFNTTDNGLELYDNAEWIPVGSTTFTVIADEQFNGDGSTVAFTLATTQTTNSCIVSINGVVQVPGTAYSVSGVDPACVLTFTEAPAAGDLIDVRELTTTTTIRSLANDSGNAVIDGSTSSAAFDLTGNIIPTANVTYSLGNNTNRFANIYLSGSTIFLGNLQLAQGAGNTLTVTTNGTTPAPIDVVVSTTGNVTAGNVIGGTFYTNSIINNGSNGTGNIGSESTYFNTVFAKATSAQYADLAEKYVADAEYAPGIVLSFGGNKEVTVSAVDADRAVAGVVSTNPSYIMNATLEAEHVATIALTGRVPTSVTGAVAKGDLMVSNGDGTARAEADPKAGAIIGKALENFTGSTGVIEVVIGRF